MSQDNFDEHIKRELEGLQESYDPSSWDDLSNRMDEENAAIEQRLDEVIKQKLTNYEAPLAGGDWDELSDEMDKREERRRRIILLKFVEVAIVILLIGTVQNYSWLKKSGSIDMDTTYIREINHQIVNNAELFVERSLKSEGEISRISESTLTSLSSIRYTHVINNKVVLTPMPLSPLINMPSLDQTTNEKLSKIAVLPLQTLTISTDLPELNVSLPIIIDEKEDVEHWISLPISYDLNTMSSTLKPNFGHFNNDLSSQGQTVGMLYGAQWKNLEVLTGVLYGEKDFKPLTVTNYDRVSKNSFLESSLNNIHIRQISVPLYISASLPSSSKWQAYGLIGASFNNILSLDYDIKRIVQPNVRAAAASTKDLLDLKELPQGSLQGGSIFDNSFLSYTIGIGVKTDILPDLQCFMQPSFTSSLSTQVNSVVGGMHSLRLEMGFKVRL